MYDLLFQNTRSAHNNLIYIFFVFIFSINYFWVIVLVARRTVSTNGRFLVNDNSGFHLVQGAEKIAASPADALCL